MPTSTRSRKTPTASGSAEALAKLEPLPENLFRVPVDLLLTDHYRQTLVSEALSAIVTAPHAAGTPARAEKIAHFLESDLVHHMNDEEEALGTRLLACAREEDGVPLLLARLRREHAAIRETATAVQTGLETLAVRRRLPDPGTFAAKAETLVAAVRATIAWQNRLLLPLARRRLGNADLWSLGQTMATRRGISFPA
ncbi:MAG: hemerythrin domain-containing protein [Alphaproteobacteria bacterium]|nr:MAG: hemerythrin domain-containing protein [Alphaproteobacteria bacterium]